jgi:hypothetical protein
VVVAIYAAACRDKDEGLRAGRRREGKKVRVSE